MFLLHTSLYASCLKSWKAFFQSRHSLSLLQRYLANFQRMVRRTPLLYKTWRLCLSHPQLSQATLISCCVPVQRSVCVTLSHHSMTRRSCWKISLTVWMRTGSLWKKHAQSLISTSTVAWASQTGKPCTSLWPMIWSPWAPLWWVPPPLHAATTCPSLHLPVQSWTVWLRNWMAAKVGHPNLTPVLIF